MLKRTSAIAIFLLTLISGLSFYVIMNPSRPPIVQQKLLASKEETRYPTRQMRSGVYKDIWISDETGRLHHQIKSPCSFLTAIPKGHNLELVEEMQGLKCYLQENLSDGTQQIRYIESKSGVYSYNDGQFNADQVFLALFRLPGKELCTQLDVNEAFLKGVAEVVSLSFAEGSPDFHAETFKAHIRPEQREINE